MSTSVCVPHFEHDRLIGPPAVCSGGRRAVTFVTGVRARGGRAAARDERAPRTGRGGALNCGRGRPFFLGLSAAGTVPAAENRACLPGGTRFSGRRGPASWRSAGAQNSARLPSGSGESAMASLPPGASRPDQPTRHGTDSSSRARARYAAAPADVGACWRMHRPNSGASAKRTDFRTGGSRISSP